MALDSYGREANPLDKFQSYSCHHILMVASTSEALLEIQRANTNGNFSSASFENVSLTEPIAGTKKKNSSGVYVVCDTRKNSNFQIKSVNYECMIAGPTRITAPAIAGSIKMQLTDFYGITFLNYLQYLCDIALNTDYTGMVWVLKTVFIGHTDRGTTEAVSSTEIPMTLTKIDTEFREDGGHYSLEFVQSSMGAPSQRSETCRVGQSSTHIKSDQNRTLASVIQDFQNHLNKELKDYYDKLRVIQKPASSAPNSGQTQTEDAQVGRLVQYMFTIPKEWNDWTVDGASEARRETNWKSEMAQKSKKDTKAPVGAVTIALQPDMSIEAALEEIFKHCDQLLARASQKKKNKDEELKLWKIVSGVTSDDQTVCLHWDIYDHIVADVSKDDNGKPTFPKAYNSDDKGIQRPVNSLEFDYIYSGKNSDIMKFEMKMASVNTLLSTAVVHDAQSKVLQNQKNNTPGKDTPKKTNVTFIRSSTPIYMPAKTADQLDGFSYIAPGSTQEAEIRQQYLNTLSKWYAQSSTNCSMTIRGNPYLLNLTAYPLAPHVPGVLASDSKNTPTNVSAQTEYRNFVANMQQSARLNSLPLNKELHAYPLLVKVNVYGPNMKEYNFDGQNASNDFAKKFWFDKYYRCVRIVNNFDASGQFTQELYLIVGTPYDEPATAPAEKK